MCEMSDDTSDVAASVEENPHSPEHVERERDSGPVENTQRKRTRKSECFLDPSAVTLHCTDFTVDDVRADAEALEASQAFQPPQSIPNVEEHYAQMARAWELHFWQTSSHFFPLKNYLLRAFPTLVPWAPKCAGGGVVDDVPVKETHPESTVSRPQRRIVMECGCGTGSAILPLLNLCPDDVFVVFDVSPRAVQLLREHKAAAQHLERGQLLAFAHDVTSHEEIPFPQVLAGASPPVLVDKLLLVFVLGAVPNTKMRFVLRKLAAYLKSDGELLFRDYAVYDNNYFRFRRRGNCIAGGSFVKGDGTQQFFFELQATREMFAECGLVCDQLEYHCNRVRNRATGVAMDKVFLNGVFHRNATDHKQPD